MGARSTNHAPCTKASVSRSAIATANRVLPAPAGPTSVSRRAPSLSGIRPRHPQFMGGARDGRRLRGEDAKRDGPRAQRARDGGGWARCSRPGRSTANVISRSGTPCPRRRASVAVRTAPPQLWPTVINGAGTGNVSTHGPATTATPWHGEWGKVRRSLTASFSKMCNTWVFTVATETTNSRAISGLVRPAASSRRAAFDLAPTQRLGRAVRLRR